MTRALSAPRRRSSAWTRDERTAARSMLLHGLLFIIGIAALYVGAEWLVRGAGRLALGYGVRPVAVGLTIVAFGTSTPELVVSVTAAASGQSDLAVGNVIGSNIVNVAVILGLTALLKPFQVELRLLSREIPLMIAISLLLPLLAADGTVGRVDGLLLLLAFAGFIIFVFRAAEAEPPNVAAEFEQFEVEAFAANNSSRAADAGLVVVGLAALLIGARLMVQAAVFFAEAAGVSQLVIGLTIVAIGTSLPELATSLVAAWRGEGDIALGNVIGSNVFNVLAIVGTASVFRPLEVAPALLRFEIPVMILLSLLVLPFGISRLRIERWEGAVLLAIYVAFTGIVIAGAT